VVALNQLWPCPTYAQATQPMGDTQEGVCPSNEPTLVANSESSVYSWARRSAQPASVERFGLARDAKDGLLAEPANSPPDQPRAWRAPS